MIGELSAPVGCKLHALHHLFPSLPYHALSTAHQRLMAPPTRPTRPIDKRSAAACSRNWRFCGGATQYNYRLTASPVVHAELLLQRGLHFFQAHVRHDVGLGDQENSASSTPKDKRLGTNPLSRTSPKPQR